MTDQGVMGAEAGDARGAKVDWRTGKPMVEYDEAFWQEHERRRVEQGLSIPQYCTAHGLALSTFRHRVSGKKRSTPARAAAAPASPSFVAVTKPHSTAAVSVEVVVQGMTVRLGGEAAQQVLARVMERLA